MAADNWDIGCNVFGKLFNNVTTCCGKAARSAHSRDKVLTWFLVGTSPVTNSQNKPSGNGSAPPSAFGKTFWHSGMDRPRKRIPSSASKTDVSVTNALMPRIPPYNCSMDEKKTNQYLRWFCCASNTLDNIARSPRTCDGREKSCIANWNALIKWMIILWLCQSNKQVRKRLISVYCNVNCSIRANKEAKSQIILHICRYVDQLFQYRAWFDSIKQGVIYIDNKA